MGDCSPKELLEPAFNLANDPDELIKLFKGHVPQPTGVRVKSL
jgi:hypothetical protein